MIVLALETATSHQSVGVFDDQRLLAYLECEVGRPLTPQIIPVIDRLLSSVSLQFRISKVWRYRWDPVPLQDYGWDWPR